MSNPVRVLTVEEVASMRRDSAEHIDCVPAMAQQHFQTLADSHESLRTQLAEAETQARERTLKLDRLGRAFDAQVVLTQAAERTGWRNGLEAAIAACPPRIEIPPESWQSYDAAGYNRARRDYMDALERLRDTDPVAPERGGQS